MLTFVNYLTCQL